MTRNEFIDSVDRWHELVNFCYDEGCYICDDIYSEDTRDDFINEELVDLARDSDSWQDLLRNLQNVPDGYDYYERDDYGDWYGLNDYNDFDRYKNDVLEWMDERDAWDEDDDEEEYIEPTSYAEDETPIDEEPIAIADLITGCNSDFQKIQETAELTETEGTLCVLIA